MAKKYTSQSDAQRAAEKAFVLSVLRGTVQQSDEGPYVPPVLEQLNWILLEPDETIVHQVLTYLSAQRGHRKQSIDEPARLRFILSFRPNRMAVGLAGFRGYLAYVFESYHKTVLENSQQGNAIYVFGANWEEFSRLSKTKLMKSNLSVVRIVHKGDWQFRLYDAIKGSQGGQMHVHA